jgi:hypothetical protein
MVLRIWPFPPPPPKQWQNSNSSVGGIPTINVRMLMVCSFVYTLCNYTTRIMRSSLMLLVFGLIAMVGRL